FGLHDPFRSFALCEDAAVEPLDPLRQLWQAAKPGKLLLEFTERPRGRAPDNLPASHDLPRQDSCLRAKPGLTTKGHILSNHDGPRYPCLRRDDRVFPDAYVVRNVDKVVQFRACPD